MNGAASLDKKMSSFLYNFRLERNLGFVDSDIGSDNTTVIFDADHRLASFPNILLQ
jgi:hypothetical protein